MIRPRRADPMAAARGPDGRGYGLGYGLGSRRKRPTSARPVRRLRPVRRHRGAPPNPWARGGLDPAPFPWNSARLGVPELALGDSCLGLRGARCARPRRSAAAPFPFAPIQRYGSSPGTTALS